jgi:hypothetical protein
MILSLWATWEVRLLNELKSMNTSEEHYAISRRFSQARSSASEVAELKAGVMIPFVRMGTLVMRSRWCEPAGSGETMENGKQSLRKLRNYLLRIVVFCSVFWTFFCLIAGGFAWIVVQAPRGGDDTGLGILCISIPIAAGFAGFVFVAYERSIRNRL